MKRGADNGKWCGGVSVCVSVCVCVCWGAVTKRLEPANVAQPTFALVGQTDAATYGGSVFFRLRSGFSSWDRFDPLQQRRHEQIGGNSQDVDRINLKYRS